MKTRESKRKQGRETKKETKRKKGAKESQQATHIDRQKAGE
jgi:hypothetical protein